VTKKIVRYSDDLYFLVASPIRAVGVTVVSLERRDVRNFDLSCKKQKKPPDLLAAIFTGWRPRRYSLFTGVVI
jgi:hypothetical protein